eukprot:gene39529-53451_t
MRRTLRASMKAGGALIDLKYLGPKVKEPPIVALLDISGSMSEYTRLFLHFLHAITDARKRVSVFLFGTRLVPAAAEQPALGQRLEHFLRAFGIEYLVIGKPFLGLRKIGALIGPQRLALAAQCLDRCDQRAAGVDPRGDGVGVETEMFGDQL